MIQAPNALKEGTFILLNPGVKENYATHQGDTWHKHKITDKELIEWKGNLGFLCGSNNIRVIDIEGKAKGNIFFEDLTTSLDNLNTFKVQTPSGGFHYYITNNDTYQKSYFNIMIKKIKCGEFRARDCYVVAPGSEVNGKTYSIVNNAPIQEVPLEKVSSLLNITTTKEPTPEQVEATSDESKSGKEYKEVCRLQSKALREKGKVLTFDELNKEMQAFIKWTSAHEQYRQLTYKKATEFIQSQPLPNSLEKEKPKEAPLRKLNFVTSKDIMNTPKDKRFIVQHIILPNTVTQIFSPPACFKSLLALCIALCVSNGKDFLGFKVKKSSVLLLDKENNRGLIRDRVNALFNGMNLKRKTFPLVFLLREGMLDNPEFVEQLAEEIKKRKIMLVIFDTLIRFSGGKENSAEDMNKIYSAFLKIQETTGAGILFLHHSNREGEYRGSSDLMGFVDCQFKITRKNQKTDTFRLINTKNRAGEVEDLYGEFLFAENKIILNKSEKQTDGEDEGPVKFNLARALILDYAKANCPTETHSFKRADLLQALNDYNFEHQDNLIQRRTFDSAIYNLKKHKILAEAGKKGTYTFLRAQTETINKWSQPLEQEKPEKEGEND